jgi:hypothetical protein
MNDPARNEEMVALGAAWTSCLAEEMRLRRLLKEVAAIEDETLGTLSHDERVILAKRVLKGEA